MKFAQKIISSFFLLSSLTPILALGTADFCQSLKTQVNKTYTEATQFVDKKLNTFSNQKQVATQADQMLSQLISKKSPAILSWMGKRDFKNKSEDAIAREWRVYFAKNFIIPKYLEQSAEIKENIENIFSEINNKIFNEQFRDKVDKIFQSAKIQSIKKIKTFPIQEARKNLIIERLNKVSLYWLKSLKDSKFEKMPLEWMAWGVAYDPIPNEINIGLEILKYKSDSTLFSVLVHELAHSFDSCRYGAFFNGEFPFQKISDCLRSDRSVGAKKRDDQKLSLYKLPKELVESLKNNPTCNKAEYPPLGVQADQLPESFADWFSAEVVSTSEYVDRELRSDLCESQALSSGSSYPINLDRLHKIYLAQPEIRKKLNLNQNSDHYCAF